MAAINQQLFDYLQIHRDLMVCLNFLRSQPQLCQPITNRRRLLTPLFLIIMKIRWQHEQSDTNFKSLACVSIKLQPFLKSRKLSLVKRQIVKFDLC